VGKPPIEYFGTSPGSSAGPFYKAQVNSTPFFDECGGRGDESIREHSNGATLLSCMR
jgi:hypothetical protein